MPLGSNHPGSDMIIFEQAPNSSKNAVFKAFCDRNYLETWQSSAILAARFVAPSPSNDFANTNPTEAAKLDWFESRDQSARKGVVVFGA